MTSIEIGKLRPVQDALVLYSPHGAVSSVFYRGILLFRRRLRPGTVEERRTVKAYIKPYDVGAAIYLSGNGDSGKTDDVSFVAVIVSFVYSSARFLRL